MTNFKDAVMIQAVKRGAELLDEALPGWAKVINVRLLNLATPNPETYDSYSGAKQGTGCILCQLDHFLDQERDKRIPNHAIELREFGEYTEGLSALKSIVGDFDLDEGAHGFDILDEWEDPETEEIWCNEYSSEVYYQILDNLWKEEIAQRLPSSN